MTAMPSDDTVEYDGPIDHQILLKLTRIDERLGELVQLLTDAPINVSTGKKKRKKSMLDQMPAITKPITDADNIKRPGDLVIWYLSQPQHRGAAYDINSIADALVLHPDVAFEHKQITHLAIGVSRMRRADELVVIKPQDGTASLYRAADTMPPCIDTDLLPRCEIALPAYTHQLATLIDKRMRESGWFHVAPSAVQTMMDHVVFRQLNDDINWAGFGGMFNQALATVTNWQLNVTVADRELHLIPE